jgi:uncharacterized membrane protein YeiH
MDAFNLNTTVSQAIIWLDLFGVAVFALSGALEASRRQMDLVGFMLIATVTGIGGGTIRDLLLGVTPVFWITSPHFVMLTAGVALVVFFSAHFFESRFKVLLWADALGLAVAAVIGTEKAVRMGAPAIVVVVMGVMTATFGGLVRDILCNEVPLILRKEIYATAAAFGAVVYLALSALGVAQPYVVVGACGAAFMLRAVAICKHWSLPVYKARAGRDVS